MNSTVRSPPIISWSGKIIPEISPIPAGPLNFSNEEESSSDSSFLALGISPMDMNEMLKR